MNVGQIKVTIKATPRVGFRVAWWAWALAVLLGAPEFVRRPLRAIVASRIGLLLLFLLPAFVDASVWRKQSTTSNPVQWLMVSSTDHLTPATGLTVTATCSKNGGSFGACSGAVSEVGNGVYSLAGNATDRATLGTLVIRATATGADDAFKSVEITAVDPFDGDFGLADLDAAVSSRLAPTTAGRTLDVTATGAAGIDWGNLENPTTSNNLSGTTIAAVSGAVGSVTGSVGGNVTGSVGSVASGGITTSSFGAGAIDAAAIATDAFTADELAASFIAEFAIPTVGQIADGVWDEPTPHNTASTMGALVTAAGSAGDPWATSLPGSYTLPEAGAILAGIQGQTDLIVSGEVTVASPFNPVSGKLTLTRGDDYAGGDLPAFTSEDWPDLTGATVRLTVRKRLPNGSGGDVLLTMTDTTAERVDGPGEQSVLFEPLATAGDNNQVGTTDDLIPGSNTSKWDIQATLAGGTVRTLATGLMDVVEDITRP